MPLIDPALALSTRQEAFRRHYAVSGNAADAASPGLRSGARQTGCALLERPWIVERARRTRAEIAGPAQPAALRRAALSPLPGDADFAPDHDIA